MPSVSIIIPTFNRKSMVCKAIDSALQQTFTDHEIIVVDDGSSDGTKKFLNEKYQDSIIILCQENQGPAVARNTGILESKGDYLAFLDSDDTWKPEKLESQLKKFDSTIKPGLIYCGTLNIYIDGKSEEGKIPSKSGMIYDQLLEQNFIGGSSNVVILKDCLNYVGLFNPEYSPAEDYDLWLRIAKKYPVQHVPQFLVNYYVHSGGISSELNKMEEAQKKILEQHIAKSANGTSLNQKKINYFINFYAKWSKIYLSEQKNSDFKRNFDSFLSLNPTDIFSVDNNNLMAKEKLVFDSIQNHFDNNPTKTTKQQKQIRCKFYNTFAYKYYSLNNMRDFRRLFLVKTINDSAINLPRNIINYLKSFFGKNIADSIHEKRKKLCGLPYHEIWKNRDKL